MSLQGLVSGAECAVPFNPLNQVLKHTEGDRSVQQDRVAGPSSSRLHHLPTTAGPAAASQDMALARQFFETNAAVGTPNGMFARPHIPPPEMTMQMSRANPMDLNRAWTEVREHDQAINHAQQANMSNMSNMQAHSGWASEFGGSSQAMASAPSAQLQGLQQSSYMGSSMYGNGMRSMGMFNSMNMNAAPVQQIADNGKGKARQIDFDAAFAELDLALGPSEAEMAKLEMFDDTADLSEALERAALREKAQEEVRAPSGFQEAWQELQESGLPPPQEDLAKWEAQYNQMMAEGREDLDFDYSSVVEEAYNESAANDTSMKFDDQGIPVLGEYTFETDNRYLDPSTSTSSYLSDAKTLLEQGGSLTEVGLMLEAAIQKGDLGRGGYEAWLLLGEVRSMDEREEACMRALSEGVKRAEQAGEAGEGMLSLAISFTNESYERASHAMLLKWLHARFPAFPIADEAWKSLTASAWSSHERVTEAFINLARDQHGRGELDGDVQIGLGVLFYANGQFDRAKDCFEAALSVRPNDYLLWNRLGSSLSNGSKSEEALGAYRQALQLRPTYTRAIYNVGVACLNLGAHKEAAEHFLSVLSMQTSGGGTKSDQVWFTLRRTFLAMDRQDLADQAHAGTDLDMFRKEGFDF